MLAPGRTPISATIVCILRGRACCMRPTARAENTAAVCRCSQGAQTCLLWGALIPYNEQGITGVWEANGAMALRNQLADLMYSWAMSSPGSSGWISLPCLSAASTIFTCGSHAAMQSRRMLQSLRIARALDLSIPAEDTFGSKSWTYTKTCTAAYQAMLGQLLCEPQDVLALQDLAQVLSSSGQPILCRSPRGLQVQSQLLQGPQRHLCTVGATQQHSASAHSELHAYHNG